MVLNNTQQSFQTGWNSQLLNVTKNSLLGVLWCALQSSNYLGSQCLTLLGFAIIPFVQGELRSIALQSIKELKSNFPKPWQTPKLRGTSPSSPPKPSVLLYQGPSPVRILNRGVCSARGVGTDKLSEQKYTRGGWCQLLLKGNTNSTLLWNPCQNF